MRWTPKPPKSSEWLDDDHRIHCAFLFLPESLKLPNGTWQTRWLETTEWYESLIPIGGGWEWHRDGWVE